MFAAASCTPSGIKLLWAGNNNAALTGSVFYKQAATYGWQQRDALALEWVLSGKVPAFMSKFEKVHAYITDSSTGEQIHAWFDVSPDYLCVGTDDDWARVPITPMAAQKVADSLKCFLPTRKMVDDIYQQATVKLEPMPMYAFRDSTPTMYHHHLIIEGQRKGRPGLIAGIKKDVVISGKVLRDGRPNRVAIYGWHKPDGQPIQPLYTGHVNWYVDYSHGIRLVQQTIYINKKPMHFTEVLQHPVYRRLLCDEEDCDMYRY
jgi:hypothetical protein